MSDHFSKISSAYHKYRPVYPNTFFEFLFDQVKNTDLALDCGTGNGQVAQFLAERFDKVYATDISLDQLSIADYNRKVEYLQFPAEDLPFADDVFDLVAVGQAAHWFDLEKFYSEVKRVCKNGALIAIFGYGDLEINQEDLNSLYKGFRESVKDNFPKEEEWVQKKYEGIPFPFEEISIEEEFSISSLWDIEHLSGYISTWPGIQNIITDKTNPLNAFKELFQQTQGGKQDFRVTFPMFVKIGRIEK
ncbi:class I SAM-dependent methyltransferase [Algivirga pacifica]|uniref:Class I SAM-dependent methyltransferase n=1 Tax=Algivirga pacifica TaxID=1162670 RepID=A0ABP9DH20_9BACT